jgi:hypothetical protein
LRAWLPALALLLILTLSVWPALTDAKGEFNLHVTQAGAWLQGRADVPAGTDVSVLDGKNYVSFPPFPSLLVLPVVAMAGVQATNTVLIALLLSALNIALLLGICRAWQIENNTALWASAGFILGSAYWQAVWNSGGVWNFSHVVSVTCGLLAIYLAKRTGLGLLAGVCIGLSFLTRQLTIFTAVFAVVVLWQHPRLRETKSRWLQLALFAIPIALCVAVYLGYNAVRFGNPLQTGYTLMPLSGFLQERFAYHGLFDLRYLPFNLYYLLLAGFELTFAPPALLRPIGLSPFGTAITLASPFIFAAFLARGNRPLLMAAWASIALIIVPQLFYYNNGWIQFNAQRFTLDFWPMLFVLIVLGAQRAPHRLWRAAIIFAIALNAITWAFLAKVI